MKFLLITTLTTAIAVASIENVCAQGSDWLKPDEPLSFDFPVPIDSSALLRFVINQQDVTDLVERVATSTWVYNSELLALPAGEIELQVYLVNDGDWKLQDSRYFNVLTRSGFKRAELSVSGSLNLNARLDEGARGDAFTSEESTDLSASGFVSVQTEHERGNSSLTSSLNVNGVSERGDALRYADRGDDASVVDLSDYIVSYRSGKFSLDLGHTSFAGNTMLVSNLAHRGISMGYQLSQRFDISLTVQNGSYLAGWHNFLGLNENKHQILASVVGIDLNPKSPGTQRLELTYLNGKTQAITDFGVGEIADAERNTGWGIAYQASLFENRMSIDSNFAKSRYLNLQDPFLFQGDDVVDVTPSTDTAWYIDFGFEAVLPNYENAFKNFATRVQYRKERADALYRSIAAFVNADNIREELTISGNIQFLNWSLNASDLEDNVDNIPNILKTGTRSRSIQLNFNVADWLSLRSGSWTSKVWPSIDLSAQRVTQRALNNPLESQSGFNGGSHLPNQLSKVLDISFNWQIGNGSFGLNLSQSDQDNRQVGRENDDFERFGWNVNSSYPITENISLSASFGQQDSDDIAQQTTFTNKNGNILIQWMLPKSISVETSLSKNQDDNSLGSSSSETTSQQFALSQQWQLGAGALSGQWFVRYTQQKNESENSIFGFASEAETWLTTAGFSMNF